MNILQALVIFLWVVVANSWFSYGIIGAKNTFLFPPSHEDAQNVIWLGKTTAVDATWTKAVMITQASLGTIATAIPCFVYVLGVAFALIGYWFPHPSCSHTTPLLNTEEELDTKTRLETKKWAYSFGGALFVVCLILILSVELTIRDARLRPNNDIYTPGQLLPLIAGVLSLASAIADILGYHLPERLAELERRARALDSSSSGSSTSLETHATSKSKGKGRQEFASVSDVSSQEYCSGALSYPQQHHGPRPQTARGVSAYTGTQIEERDLSVRSRSQDRTRSRSRSISAHRHRERVHDEVSLHRHHSDVSIHRHGSEIVEHRHHDDVSMHRHRDDVSLDIDVEREERERERERARIRDFAYERGYGVEQKRIGKREEDL